MAVTLRQRMAGGAWSNCAISSWQAAIQHPGTDQAENTVKTES